jgi:hypothetical protein
MPAIPDFPLKRVKHKIPPTPKEQFVVATWTRYNCTLVTEKPVNLTQALKEYGDRISTTSENLVIGILDHKHHACFKSRGERRTFTYSTPKPRMH